MNEIKNNVCLYSSGTLGLYNAELLNDREDAYFLIWNHNKEIDRNLSDEELDKGIKKFLELGNAIGIVLDNHLISFLVLYCRHIETRQAYVCNVYVLPAYRGNGLSGILLEKAFDIAKGKGFNSIQIHVADNNYPAITIYKRHGFIANGKYKKESDKTLIEMVAQL